jgi:hypothetical protein
MQLALLAAATLAAATCFAPAGASAAADVTGSGHAVTEERAVSGFHGLAISVPSEVDLRQGASEGLALTADDNVLPRIRTFVDAQGVLEVRFPRNVIVRPRTPIRISVRAKRIDSIALAGHVRLESGALRADRLKVNLAGDAGIALPDLETDSLVVHTSGHSHVMAAGKADALDLGIAGSGEANLARLAARRAAVRIAGSAEVAAWARERLEVRITGSGAVRYFGDPQVRKRIAGSGRVERLGDSPP